MNTVRIRGIQSVKAELDPKAVLANLQSSWDEFKVKNDLDRKKLSDVENQLNAIETAVARSQFPGGTRSSSLDPGAKAEHFKAFDDWFRRGVDNGLGGLEIKAGLRTSSDPDGGFMVPDEIDKNLNRISSASVAMRRLANLVTLSEGNYQRPISLGGAVSGWVGELETRNDTDSPSLAMFSPPWCEVYAMPETTQKLLDLASFDVGAWLVDEISISENELEGEAFILGDGVGKPKGILRYDAVENADWEFGKVGYITSGHAALMNSSDRLIDLQHSLKPVYRQNAVWLMADSTWSVIRKLKDGDNNYLWKPGLEKGAPDMLLGKPVEIDDNMPSIGADAFPVALGDWKRAYTIGGHTAGRRLLRDPLTKKGWCKYYSSKRVFGGSHNTEAYKLLKIAE